MDSKLKSAEASPLPPKLLWNNLGFSDIIHKAHRTVYRDVKNNILGTEIALEIILLNHLILQMRKAGLREADCVRTHRLESSLCDLQVKVPLHFLTL